MKAETKQFHELIKAANYAHYKYNEGNKQASQMILAQMVEYCQSLSHHIKNGG